MKAFLDGLSWSMGIAVGLGVISLFLSFVPWTIFDSFEEYELPIIDQSEYRDFKSVVRNTSIEQDDLFEYHVSGQFNLEDQSKYETIEVFVSLYNTDGIFLGKYSSDQYNVASEDSEITFKIQVLDFYNSEEIEEFRYTVGAK